MRFFFTLFLYCLIASQALALNNTDTKLLADTDFLYGYEVMSPERDIYTDRSKIEKIYPGKSQEQKPYWRLVQWGSGNSISGSSSASAENLSSISKRVVIDKSLLLELNGLSEFSSTYYTNKKKSKEKTSHYLASADEYWPHLLMVQNIKTEKLSTYQSIHFSMDARLLFDNKNIREGFQPDMHAARFIISMAVRSRLSNNSFWLNAVIYDSRYPSPGFLCKKCKDESNKECYEPISLNDPGRWVCPFDGQRWSKDSEKKGTRRMLFRIPTSAMTTEDIRNGEWTHYAVDFLPYIKAGIAAAQADKTLRAFPPSLDAYDLTMFSIGWEITGFNHAGMELKNLNLTGL